MKTKKQINRMLEGYTVGRPQSRNRKVNNIDVFLKSEYGVITVYAYDSNNSELLFEKKFYNSWFEAFNYYYNTIETLIKNKQRLNNGK